MGPGLTAARTSLERCSQNPIQLQYLAVPSFSTQTQAIASYLKALPTTSGKPIFVASVGYWEKSPEVPASYLAMLASLRDKASKVFLVNIATGYQPANSRKDAYIQRNAAMKAWAQEQGPPFFYVDYDSLSTAPNPKPPSPLGGDKHFMCALWWHPTRLPKVRFDASREGADAAGSPLPQIPEGSVERIQVTADGKCADETDRNLWQMIFNVLV